jgi:hypothetical protein
LVFVVLFKATEYGIDIRFVDLSPALCSDFFAELFVVAGAESRHRRAVDALKLASGVVVVEHIIGRILSVLPLAVSAFYHVNAIVITIK